MAANFEIETVRINVGASGYFTVRGMSSEDVTFLTVHYLEDLKTLIARYATRGTIQRTAVADLILEAAKDFPMMIVEIISRCADLTSAEDTEKFRRLSFVKQIEALKVILTLTTEDGVFDVKKVLGVVESLLTANGIKSGPLMKSLQTIIETSGKPLAI